MAVDWQVQNRVVTKPTTQSQDKHFFASLESLFFMWVTLTRQGAGRNGPQLIADRSTIHASL